MTPPTRSLAGLASRGAVINVVFGIGTQFLAGIQGIVVPRLLGPKDIGLFALAIGGVTVGATLKELGIPQKLVQERDVDLHTAYAVAFTLELLLAGTFFFIVLGVAPLLAWAYHKPQLTLLVAVLSFSIFSTAFLDLPAALPYREMRFVRRNMLISIGPVTTFLVTVPTAYLGWGIWSLVAGTTAGFLVSALVLLVAGPIRPRFAWEPKLVRRYFSFGWPLWVSGVVGMAAGWGAVIAISSVVGIAGLGYFQLAQGWASRALQVDSFLSDAIFPALCSIQSSTERLRRAFVTTNRLSMLWAAPVGAAIFLFAAPAVHLLLGPAWNKAILLVQAEGAGVIVTSIGFNWNVFFAAQGKTRPQLVVGFLGVAWLIGIVVPFLEIWELDGAAASIVVLAIGTYSVRQFYLNRLLGRFSLAALVWRELLVAGIGSAVVGLARLAGWEVHSMVSLIGQGVLLVVACAVAALVVDRNLIAETLAALRDRPVAGVAAAPAHKGRRTTPPRAMSFPLGVAVDDAGVAWATTRDWPALGRQEAPGGEWRWTPLPPFPHLPDPDGRGGCWSALTRASALVHVDAAGAVTTIPLPRTRELLTTTRHLGAVWVVDGYRKVLLRVDETGHDVHEIALGDEMVRPDFVAVGPDGRLWVADTDRDVLARVDPATASVDIGPAPHPTRFAVADRGRRGIWLGGSTRPVASLVDATGAVVSTLDLPGIPFGVTVAGDGRLLIALKQDDAVLVVDPDDGRRDLITLEAAAGPTVAVPRGDHLLVALSGAGELAELELPVPARLVSG